MSLFIMCNGVDRRESGSAHRRATPGAKVAFNTIYSSLYEAEMLCEGTGQESLTPFGCFQSQELSRDFGGAVGEVL